MSDRRRFTGRFLYLSDKADIVAAQIAGTDVTLEAARPLRESISTDEITPVTVMLTYDERLGRYPYVGFQAGGVKPIGTDAVKNGGFEITVAGKRYGKGSSRESSPIAEQAAGIRLIIAESFERIYQQNCDNIGVLTSTDFGLIPRIMAGEEIDIEEFTSGRDDLTKAIIRAGGLMPFSRGASWPLPSPRDGAGASGPMTLVEKILRRHAHPDVRSLDRGTGIFVHADWRFSHDYFTGMSAHIMHKTFGKPAPLRDPDSIVAFYDHLVLAGQSLPHRRDGLLEGVGDLLQGHHDFAATYPVKVHGSLPDGSGSEGICHALMTERYALPGQVVVGTDSHTPHSGALGCLAFGAGSTDVAHSWVTGYIRCVVPETLRVEIEGALRPGVTAKDVVLHLLQMDEIKSGGAIGAVFEFAGSAVRAMSVDERATLTNMVAELGGFTGIVAPDEKTVAFLKERRGIDFQLEDWMTSDPGATYRRRIDLDGADLTVMVARPGDPGNGIAIDDVPSPVRVDIAYGGSCTAGKREDFDNYHEVLRWGVERGLKVAEGTRLFLQFGTMDVHRYCQERGYLDTFRQVGATLLMPGCGACANCGPGQSVTAGEVTVSAINRNFPGRSGPGQVWLASPFTVASSALSGRISSFVDLQETHGSKAA
ncbi:aconitase family protein [Enterovirga sp.]|uniref:aconitase family protein n=1 Tax=Enterovirga sp. TaxID=2026350 RepID=UPI00262F19C9|nr:aconitase family protein [Enterovirga sp.]MDB5590326.1 3-isopropylmalate dehydratase [Enterovirga sp.]